MSNLVDELLNDLRTWPTEAKDLEAFIKTKGPFRTFGGNARQRRYLRRGARLRRRVKAHIRLIHRAGVHTRLKLKEKGFARQILLPKNHV